MTASDEKTPAITHFRSRMELHIEAPRDRVWEALASDMGVWWPGDFYFSKPPHEFVLEARAGGRVYEKGGDGFELLWGTILAVEPGRALNWHAVFSPPYSGPGDSYIHVALDDHENGGTAFTLTQHYVGVPGEGLEENMSEGWKAIFDVAMRKHVEG